MIPTSPITFAESTFNSPQVENFLVVGLGLIGGSLTLAAQQAGFAKNYWGVDLNQEERQAAKALGVVSQTSASLETLAPQADFILLAVPVLAMPKVLAQLKPLLKPTAVITDVGSTKQAVLTAAEEVFGELPPKFILGHPIAGAEKSGVQAAKADLFNQHKVILCPQTASNKNTSCPEALALVSALWQAAGAEVICMSVSEHDQVLARTSHLPHLLAFSLVETLANKDERLDIFRYAAGGFRDFTRVAASDPIMWRDIFLANKTACLDALDEFTQGLEQLKHLIETNNSAALVASFSRAKSARDYFTALLNQTAYQTMQNQELTLQTTPGTGALVGSLRVPGDKSISHRAIMLGSLAEGITQVEGFLEGEDALATLQAFRAMGVVIEGPKHGKVTLHGVGMNGLQAPNSALYLGNSGTTMRLLAGLLAAQKFDSQLTGDASLSTRPMRRVTEPLALMGGQVATAEEGTPPLNISGNQQLTGITYALPMASAQVKSCLLLAGLWAEGTTTITEPAPTRDHTERMLRGFGYQVKTEGATISLTGGGKLTACNLDIPADISSATFFMVAAAIMPGSDLTLEHVGINPTRDGVISILKLMGANIQLSNQRDVGGEPVADIRIQFSQLKGIEIPEELVALAIDEFPALFIAAACAEGTTTLTGAEELRVKESDRIQVMADGLQELGINCTTFPDGIQIEGKGDDPTPFSTATLGCHHDHRIAMSFLIAGLKASGTITIEDCAVVNTSFPNFAELLQSVGGKVKKLNT